LLIDEGFDRHRPERIGQKKLRALVSVADAGSVTRAIPVADVEASDEALAQSRHKTSTQFLSQSARAFVYL
jgi:hypothetical protein